MPLIDGFPLGAGDLSTSSETADRPFVERSFINRVRVFMAVRGLKVEHDIFVEVAAINHLRRQCAKRKSPPASLRSGCYFLAHRKPGQWL